MQAIHDFRFAIRSLRRNSGSTVVILLALALGITINAVIFSLVDSVLFKPLPGKNPEQLIDVFSITQKGSSQFQPAAYPIYKQYRDAMTGFMNLAAYRNIPLQLSTEQGEGRQIYGAVVTGNFFPVLAVSAEKGRLLSIQDDGARGSNPVVVLSDRLWRQLGSKNVAESSIRINGQSYSVIGVAPADLRDFDHVPELWLPMSMATEAEPIFKTQMDRVTNPFFTVLGRLAGNVSVTQAQAKLDAVNASLGAGQTIRLIEGMQGEEIAAGQSRSTQEYEEAIEWQRPWAILKAAGKNFDSAEVRLSRLLLGIAFLVLLIACVDVAGLLAARSAQKQKETAIRLAIGASRLQLFRQRFIEGILLAGSGTTIGILLAAWTSHWLLAVAPPNLFLIYGGINSVINLRVLAFVTAISIFVAIGFTVLTTWHEAHTVLLESLKGEHSSAGNRLTTKMSVQAALVVFQIAVSFVLLSGAGLLIKTWQRATKVELGFTADHVLSASLDLSRQGYDKVQAAAMLGPILDSVRRIPGIESAALGPGNLLTRQPYQDNPKHSSAGDCSNLDIVPVSPEYFTTLQVPFLQGRDFSPSDIKDAPGVVIANQAARSLCWPGQNPIGNRIARLKTLEEPFEIIGFVGNVKSAADNEAPKPLLYASLPQFYDAFAWQPMLGIVIRTKLEPHEIVQSLISAIHQLNGNLTLSNIETPSEMLAEEFAQQHFLSTLFLAFGAIALVLAIAGIYGLLSYLTARRTREFGIRLALGASRSDVLYLVLTQGCRVIVISIFLGVLAAVASSRLIQNFLFGITGTDPATYFFIAVLIAFACLIACSLPARRATRIDPLAALRDE
jgi:putative ABC transport system permease protein